MPQFDVHRLVDRRGCLVVDVQADHLRKLDTRMVVPLLPATDVPYSIGALHPVIDVQGTPHLFASHLMAAVAWSVLSPPMVTVAREREVIMRALALLMMES